MDTNLKNKNKWRWVIGIIVGLIVTVGAFFALQYILLAVGNAGHAVREGSYNSNGEWIYYKFVNGRKIRYTTNRPDLFAIGMSDNLAIFLAEYGVTLLLAAIALCMFLLVWFLRCKRIWKNTECVHRRGIAYVAELLVFALCCLPMVFIELGLYLESFNVWQEWGAYNPITLIEYVVELLCPIVGGQLYFFLCFWYLRPLFTLGVKEYLREYSLLWAIGRVCKRWWKKFKAELDTVDFSKNTTKLLMKAVLIQFAILFVCVCCWFIGIPLLIVYSVVLFFLLKRQYKKAENGYYEILRETSKIANGDLTGQIEGDFGMFQPLGEELGKVKTGFRKAVEEEVKSQRMKTELITNVSHDLKTPLTAIMTYVELLKNEDITPEERASYVDTLDKKSKRLKILIEDLFEVSRAASNNLTLHLMDVDLVQLVKQVAVEYEDKFAEVGLYLRQNMAAERAVVQLDGQKTSRILENLFANVCKYALPDSRVYAEVSAKDGRAFVTLKNISAEELTVSGEEIVERFVRGDSSRNTEGSGLGLAIAKNLTEAQGGTFSVDIDGDLFKARLSFPLKESAGIVV